MGDLLTMSPQELTRHQIFHRLQEKRLKQKEAARMLGLSLRQIKQSCFRVRQAEKRAMKPSQPQGDIATWRKRGHFYFALTGNGKAAGNDDDS
jgi:DNA-binding transcriptional MerR regulator